MIDELEYLREARVATPAPDSVLILRTRRTLLRHALVKRTRRRHIRAFAGVAAVAVVLGVVGVVNLGNTAGGGSAAAAILNQAAEKYGSLPAPAQGQYLYVKSVETDWNFKPSSTGSPVSDQAGVTSTVVETWIPGDKNRSGVERLTGGDGKVFTTPASTDIHPSIYNDYPDESASLLEALRVLAIEQGNGSDDDSEAVWRTAYGIVLDPQAPDSFKSDVMKALGGLEGVKVIDRHTRIGGKTGTALGLSREYTPQLVFDPDTGAALGARGYPERGPDWVGPGEPRYTVVLTAEIVDSAPKP